jgi:hypothetical protein
LISKSTVRYNFGTTEGEISGELTRKRRSAKHLDFLPSWLEGSLFTSGVKPTVRVVPITLANSARP